MRSSSQESSLPSRLLFDFWTIQTLNGRRGLYIFMWYLLPDTRHCIFHYLACWDHATGSWWGYTCARDAITWWYAKRHKNSCISCKLKCPFWQSLQGKTCLRDNGRNGEGQECPILWAAGLVSETPMQSCQLDWTLGLALSLCKCSNADLTTDSFNDEQCSRFN